jgi:DNA polymerase III subunit delta
VKANRGQIERALDAASADCRLFLLYGPDESSSRDLAGRLARGLGTDAERIDLDGPALKADPGRLPDEAASISLFGGKRFIRVEPAGDEMSEAAEALLAAPAAGNPVVVVAGALRKDSRLVKLALASPLALAFASYLPEGGDIDRLAAAMAREAGLRVHPDIARRLAAATGGDRALLAREIEKFALYLDAAPDRPRELDHDALDALGASAEEGDLTRLVDAVFSGRPDAVDTELTTLATQGIEGIPLIRALLRRLFVLAAIRAEIAGGSSVDAAMASAGKSVFWKEKDEVIREVRRWAPEALATALARVAEAERQLKAPGAVGTITADAELLAIARHASRMR